MVRDGVEAVKFCIYVLFGFALAKPHKARKHKKRAYFDEVIHIGEDGDHLIYAGQTMNWVRRRANHGMYLEPIDESAFIARFEKGGITQRRNAAVCDAHERTVKAALCAAVEAGRTGLDVRGDAQAEGTVINYLVTKKKFARVATLRGADVLSEWHRPNYKAAADYSDTDSD